MYGKGRWKKISVYLPNRYVREPHLTAAPCEQCHHRINHLLNHFVLDVGFGFSRSLVQIKSHAQKVIKRFDNGEDVFLRLDENMIRTEAAVAQIHEHLRNEGIPIPAAQPNACNRQTKKPRMVEVREQIVAASALCQLAKPIPSPLESLPSFALSCDDSQSKTIRDIVLGPSFPSSNVVKL